MSYLPSDFRPVTSKHMSDIQREWDRIASLRLDQITQGRDVSYCHVLEPTMLDLVQDCDRTSVLDMGCGVGILTTKLAEVSGRVIGIDISGESIGLARQHASKSSNVAFSAISIEDFATGAEERFTLITANMVLMTVLDLQSALCAVARLLSSRGKFVLTVTHPCFWPTYWRYDKADWFDYSKEIPIEAPFRLSLDGQSEFITTHVHRPLEQYFSALHTCGLAVTSLIEPQPRGHVQSEYLRTWQSPRFLAMVCDATGCGAT